MSNYLAIATVTSTLRDIVDGAVNAIIPGVTVTTQRPEKAGNGNINQAGVNVYLYQVMPNAAWRNSDIVIRRPSPQAPDNRGKDTLEQHNQIPLNLHYLFSFYGDDQKLEPQRLLGQVVSTLEAKPILSLDNIRAAIQHHETIKQSDLDFQVEHIERIKLAPLSLSLEDLSKLWFFQVPYVLSVAYEAAVVLIEPSAALTVPLVINTPNIGVDPDLSRQSASPESTGVPQP
jgi:Pvc16 N-terminal domain